VWFNNSTRLDLKHDGLEIAVPNDFISEWIGTHFKRPIQEAAHEVLGCSLPVRFSVVPQLFEVNSSGGDGQPASNGGAAHARSNGAGSATGKKNGHVNGHASFQGNGNGNGRSSGVAVASAV